MNAINIDIVKSLFMPFFLGTTLASAALAVLAIFRWGEPGACAMLAGGVVYVLGMFVVTMVVQRAAQQRARRRRSVQRRSRIALGPLPQGLDVLEPCANDRERSGVGAVHRRDCWPDGRMTRRVHEAANPAHAGVL